MCANWRPDSRDLAATLRTNRSHLIVPQGASPAARWRILPANPGARDLLAGALGVAPLAAQVLINRGLEDLASARAFLDVRLDRLSSPFALAGMDRVVDRLVRAARERTSVVVYGDYDADGITATAQLVRVLRRAGAIVDFYVPDRQQDGYGLHARAVTHLAAGGARLLVAVDCGITATAAGEAAATAGLELIILDHHEPLGHLPRAVAIVNPNLTGSTTDYCAAGLAFQACRGVLEAIKQEGAEPDLIALAALGTVADAVDLLGDNRLITASGLDQLSRSTMPGLAALREVGALEGPLRVRDLSHALAPRLNAAGRLAHAAAAVRLLTSDDPDECRRIAADLDHLNRDRRVLCDQVLAEAVGEIDTEGLADAPAIVLAREGWHPGVIGIVASQLVERYYRPTVLIALHGDIGKGSARSIPPLHLVQTLAESSEALSAFGGHAMAAGVTLPGQAVARFRTAFVEAVGRRLRAEDLQPVTKVDAEVGLELLTPALAADIERLAPFGEGNAQPVFLTRGLRAIGTRLVGGGSHLRLVVSDGVRTAEAIAFRLGDYAELLAFTQAQIDLAYFIEMHRWHEAESVQLVAVDLATPGVDLEAITADTGAVLARLFARADDYLGGRLRAVEQAPAFHTKVVGVTFEGRQAILPTVRQRERLRLVRDPRNPRDPHAIKVCLADGRQLGFLRAGLAARLAPAMDAGARYTATATTVTGGGDRAWGLNVSVEREAASTGDAGEAADVRTQWPTGGGFADWLAVRMYRGRSLSAAQREVINTLRTGGRAAARFGPGRGLVVTVAMAAATLMAGRAGPVMAVLPRATDVEAWNGLIGPWLRDIGLRVGAVHGALPAQAVAWVTSAWERGQIDVLLASASWTQDVTPAAGAVIAVLDALSSDDDVTALAGAYGNRVRLLIGPAPGEMQRAAAGAGYDRVVLDPAPRTNLRVVDHRMRPDASLAVIVDSPRPERTLIVAAGARASVEVARGLRGRYPEMAGRIAYYHDGLPAPLRRVLEDLFAAGQITVMVAGALLADRSVPIDVGRVVAAGLPPDRLLAADILGAGGLGGQIAVVELAYGPEGLAEAQAGIDERFPPRGTLVRCYQRLREQSRDGVWTWSEGPSADVGDPALTASTIASCVEVFVEAGILAREDGEGSATRYTLIAPGARIALDRSLCYREGIRVRAAWADLRAWAAGPAAAILADLAQP